MSRFGLRSHTDSTTTYDEYDDNDEDTTALAKSSENSNKITPKATTTTATKSKRSNQNKQKQKKNKKKSLTALNTDTGGGDDDDDDDDDDANDVVPVPQNNIVSRKTKPTATKNNTISLMCSLPLTRLSGILEKLQLTKNAKKQAKNLLQRQQQLQQHQKEQHEAAELKTKNALFDSLKLTTFNVQEKNTNTLKNGNFDQINENVDDNNDKDNDVANNNNNDDDNDDDNDEEEDEESTAAGIKLLCLYCDKKFLTEKLQVKHVDKFHIQQRDRRLSARNNLQQQQQQQQQQQLQQEQQEKLITTTTTTTSTTMFNEQYLNKNSSTSSLLSTKTTTTTTTQQNIIKNNFPGCTYCKKYNNKKVATTSNEYNLNSLFLHLIECHADKYFGCKMCIMRFATKQKLIKHMKNVHNKKYSSISSSNLLPQQKMQEKQQNDIEVDNDASITTTTTTTTNSQQQQQSLGKTTSTYKSTKRVLRQTRKSQQQQQQEPLMDNLSSPETNNATSSSSMVTHDEPRLSRLGLAQNRFNNNHNNHNNSKRKGLRLRRELVDTETTMLGNYQQQQQQSNCKLRSSRISTTPTTSTSANNLQSPAAAGSMTQITGGRGNISLTTSTSIITNNINNNNNLDDETTTQALFRMPIRQDLMASSYSSTTTITTTTTTTNCSTSFIIDDNFYKEVVNNVRSNLLYYLDGKIKEQQHQQLRHDAVIITNKNNNNDNEDDDVIKHVPAIRSTLVRSPLILNRGLSQQSDEDDEELLENGELHAATSLAAITAFPTLLTAEQYGGENYAKLRRRRPQTKHSWKWKWDNVKKYKLISEGGKMVKKMKPLLGLRDLSKLDMWTQLTMRQKHEQQQERQKLLQQQQQQQHELPTTSSTALLKTTTSNTTRTIIGENNHNLKRAEKLRLNEELNAILDKRLLPQIMLEQNEQAVIKIEPISTEEQTSQHITVNDILDVEIHNKNSDCNAANDNENFLLLLQLHKKTTAFRHVTNINTNSPRLVLSGEWARPRCYMCMCCGAKFDKLKSLEEHKMFRHAHIYCTHYEVVGRELLANNLLRHLFLPRRALSRYNANYFNVFIENSSSNENSSSETLMLQGNRLEWTAQHKRRSSSSLTTITTATTTTTTTTPPVEDESSDSIQSNSRYANTTPTTTITITTNTITPTTATSSSMIITTAQQQQQLSPTYSLQSCSSASFRHTMTLSLSPITTPTLRTPTKIYQHNNNDAVHVKELLRNCSKCQRKCNGSMDLYRHMLDCSGDYIWSMVKKRKYRYYCGSKKRRTRYGAELRRTPKQQQPKTPENLNEERSASSCSKSQQLKNSPTPRQRPSDAESIKKMLENLPAKRVCKQIFPMDKNNKNNKNKNHNNILKKNKQQQLQRSNLYKTNVLRQTRARQQMAQAAKILSKTKNKKQHKQQQQQLKNVSKTVAAVNDVLVVAVENDKRNLRKTKNATTAAATPTTTTTTTSNTKKSENDERQTAYRQASTKKNKQNMKAEQQQQNSNSKQQKAQQSSVEKVVIEEPKISIPPPTTTTNISTTSIKATTTITSTTPTTTRNDEVDGRSTPTCTTNTLNSSLSAQIMAMTTTTSTTPMTTRKRSKRISDCIAMLTGKLEEKLKTEQQPVTSTKINTRSSTNNNNTNNQMETITKSLPEITTTTTTTPTTVSTITILPTTPPPIKTTTTTLISPKTPKRKTQSRRIIKAPSIENLVTHVDLTVSPVEALLEQTPITKTTKIPHNILPVISLVRITTTTTTTTKPKSSLTASNIQPITTTTSMITMTKTSSNQQTIDLPITTTATIALAQPLFHNATTKSVDIPLSTAAKMNFPANFEQLPLPISMQNLAHMGVTAQLPCTATTKHNNNSMAVAKTMTVAATTTPLLSVTSSNKTKSTPFSMPTVKIPPSNYATPSIIPTSMPLAVTMLPIHMPIALPLMPAHLDTPCPPNAYAGNMEQPLNLSSSAINGPTDQNSIDLTNDRRNVNLGIPTYHMDNYNMYQNAETGPLDLSTKCNTKTRSNASKETESNNADITMPLALTVTSNARPVSQLMSTATTTTTTMAASMIMFDKQQQQYYSNLDLLKIPQIRNSAYTTTTTTANMTNIAPITTTITPNVPIINMSKYNNNNNADLGSSNNNNNIALQMLQGSAITTTKATMVVAPIIKKRGGCRQQNVYDISSLSSTISTTSTAATSMSNLNTTTGTAVSSIYANTNNNTITTTPNKTLQKKEYTSRYKAPPAPLTMNEEVINHIDDAINSVINAVKASLSPERVENSCVGKMIMVDACKSVQSEINLTTTTTNTSTSAINAAVVTTTQLPIICATITNSLTNAITSITTTTTTQPLATILPVKRRGRFVQPSTSEATTAILPTTYVANFTHDLTVPQSITSITTTANTQLPIISAEQLKRQQQQLTPLCAAAALTATTTTATTPTVSIKPRSKATRSKVCLIEDISEPMPTTTPKMLTNLKEQQTNQEQVELLSQKHNVEPSKEQQTITTTTTTTTAPISNVSATTMMPTTAVPLIEDVAVTSEQANQPVVLTPTTTTTTATPIIKSTTTPTPIENTIINNNTNNCGENAQGNGKKFRRRRKNELAAIVADQLLESFKLDKARRDNLKKLENLAYEKSDDLFMTGMLLMSSTKRSATLNSSKQKQQQEEKEQQEEVNNAVENINNDEMENFNNKNKRTGLRTRTTRQTNNNKNNNSVKNDDNTADTSVKDGRRRPYRRRGKTIDNENIIKLKSSLESFSIGIERQLTEFEAKKERLNEANVTAAVKTTSSNNNNNNNNNSCIKTKPCSVILRPSILAASIESPAGFITAPLTAENVAKVSSSLAADNAKSSAFSCRDPRLNKNIHKEMSDSLEKMGVNNSKQESKNNNVDSCEEEDNYLTEIAKNVNEKIMENEDFMFANDDGLLGLDDTQSSHFYSRPPTSMSVRSAPNFDDRSNYGSMCGDDDEITNTEIMDMDLDDNMSVYTSYSQDVGRGGRRRRRRRRSILLTRRPKKRINRDPNAAEKFECTLCKKIFFSATSLSKHNMTLAHVSKVSEQEYLLSRAAMIEQGGLVAMANELPMSFPKTTNNKRAKTPTPSTAAKRAKTPTPTTATNARGRAKTPTPNSTSAARGRPKTPTPTTTATTSKGRAKTPTPTSSASGSRGRAKTPTPAATAARGRAKTPTPIFATNSLRGRAKTPSPIVASTATACPKGRAKTPTPTPSVTSTSRRGKTPTPTQSRINSTFEDQSPSILNSNTTTTNKTNNLITLSQENLSVKEKEKHFTPMQIAAITAPENPAFGTSSHLTLNPDERLFFECCTILKGTETARPSNTTTPTKMNEHLFGLQTKDVSTVADNGVNNSKATSTIKKHQSKSGATFRDPPNYNKTEQDRMSPNYPGISQLSAVTNTSTFRIKTKAAMKGYENVDMSLPHDLEINKPSHHHHHHNTCKLTDLADIALGSEKPHALITSRPDPAIIRRGTTSVADYIPKTRTESSTSSKTIMHSSILNAVIEERNKQPEVQKIVIPERPFKNIGLEEKEAITFQKPRTTSLCLLKSGSPLVNSAISGLTTIMRDDNSITSASFSDRDDFDFNSLSCDDDDEDNAANNKTLGLDTAEQDSSNRGGVKTPTNSDEQAMIGLPPPGLSESSSSNSSNMNNHISDSGSSRAKTFENKSLIMGRIFKNNTTKVPAASVNIKPTPVRVKTPLPKADLNQLFDELRGDCNKSKINEHQPIISTTTTHISHHNEQQVQTNLEPTAVMPIIKTITSKAETPAISDNKIQRNDFTNMVSMEEKKIMTKKKVTINLPPTTSTATSPINSDNLIKAKKKVGRKPKVNKKAATIATTKDIDIAATKVDKKEKPAKVPKAKKKKQHATAKLQAELGMSPKAIREQINDEGQRKSKRRCAANSAKKFVETWSSDEYEEFLSTKDVIALIEEKEKQEMEKKKRKSYNVNANATKAVPTTTTTTTWQSDEPQTKPNLATIVETCKETYAFATPQTTNSPAGKQKTKENKKAGNKKKDKRKDQQAKNQIATTTTTKTTEEDKDLLPNKNFNKNNSNVQSLWNYTKEVSGNSNNNSNNRKRKHKHGNHGEMELSTASSGILAAESYIMPMGYNDMIGSATRPCMLITEKQQQEQQQQQPLQQHGIELELMHSMNNPFIAASATTNTTTTTLYEQQQQQQTVLQSQHKRHHHHHHHKTTSHHHHHHHHHKKHHKERKNLKRKIVLDSTDAMPIIPPCPMAVSAARATTTVTSAGTGVESLRKRGRKRKAESKSKHSRRKREKRYYWSSSSSTSSSSPSLSSSLSSSVMSTPSSSSSLASDSAGEESDDDEEYTNVVTNTNEHVIQPAKLSYQPQQQYGTTFTTSTTSTYGANNGLSGSREGGEHMQKHGWIVGDSHKKLVTMLAIAKGSNSNNNNNNNGNSNNKKVTKKKNAKKRGRQD